MAKERKPHRPHVVVLDEAEQLVRHLFGQTVGNKVTEVGEALFRCVADAQFVVCADADAGALTGKLLELCGRKGVVVINEYRKWTFSPNQQVEILENRRKKGRLQLKARIRNAVKLWKEGDAPYMVACTSCGEAKRTTADLRLQLGDVKGADVGADPSVSGVLLVCHDTREMEEVKAFLDNPDEEIKKWRCILYSPTMGTGVSIETRVEKVFGLLTSVRGFTGADNVQLLTRARNQNSAPLLWLDGRTFGDMPRTLEEAREKADRLLFLAQREVLAGKCKTVNELSLIHI